MPTPRTLLRLIALTRILLGVALTVVPGQLLRVLLGRAPGEDAVLVARMLAVRDAALGLGALLADRHGSAQVRGWAEAGALSDGVDAVVFAVARPLRPSVRVLTATIATVAAAASGWAGRAAPR